MVGNVKIALSEKIALLLHPHVDIPFSLVVTQLYFGWQSRTIYGFAGGASASVPIDATDSARSATSMTVGLRYIDRKIAILRPNANALQNTDVSNAALVFVQPMSATANFMLNTPYATSAPT